MNSENFNNVINKLDQIEKRLAKLENRSFKEKVSEFPLAPSSNLIDQPLNQDNISDNDKKNERQNKEGGNLLGYIGSACILLASVLLIKLSIDSGWLTPIRQCILASVFAVGLIIFPFFIKLKDEGYISFLPAIGIVVLHLTTYGAVFYHNLFSPILGILVISLIGILSLWLLTKFKEDTYALLAIFGIYGGAVFFHESFFQIITVALYLLIWDMVFVLFSINLKRRFMIAISSYLALILVSLIGLSQGSRNFDFHYEIIAIQTIQFVIFALATILFSIKNKVRLTQSEAWSFFPVIILFYGQQYFFLDRISHNSATFFSLAFALVLLTIYYIAKFKMKEDELESAGVVYSICSLMIFHSIFMVELSDISRIIFSLGIVALIACFQEKVTTNKHFKGPLFISALIVFCGYILVLCGTNEIGSGLLLIFGVIFGAIFLMTYSKLTNSLSSVLLNLGHIQMFVALYRLKEIMGNFAIAPLWTGYALAILYWYNSRKDKEMAQGAVLLIIIGLGRFFLFDFADLGGSGQILSLLIIGSLIFISGYFYRNVIRNNSHLS